jgi:hypothetical protein
MSRVASWAVRRLLVFVTDVAMGVVAFMTRLRRLLLALRVSARFRSSILAFSTRRIVAELTVSQLQC